MGTGGSFFFDLGQSGDYDAANAAILNSDGTVVGHIGIHTTDEKDGSVFTQLELRFENQSMLVIAPEVGMEPEGHSLGRSRVLVEMEQRQGFTEPLRFCIHIPSPARNAGKRARATEDEVAAVRAARDAIQA